VKSYNSYVTAGEYNDVATSGGESYNEIFSPASPIVKDDQDNSNEEVVYNNFNINTSFVETIQQQENEDIKQIYSETVNFKNTSFKNNMMCQVFEVNSRGIDKKLVKLDVVQRTFTLTENYLNGLSQSDKADQKKHKEKSVFYVGKTYKDNFGVPVFLKLFTIMFD
jgi:hypothetical protein